MGKNQPMEKKKKHFIAVTTSIILTILIILIIIVLAVTLTLPTGYKLVFNVDGQVTTSLEVKAKDEVVLADPAPKDGYTFGGWYFDKDTLSDPCTAATLKDKKLKGENTIYAKWIKNDYTIKYNLNGGVNAKANPSGYVVDTATIKLAAPTKLGYTFGGWFGQADFKDKAITEIAKGSTGNKELFAKWNKDTYTITYNLNGGAEVTANPTTYAIDTATITLNAPTKVGYTFGGWYSEDTFATQVTEIAIGSTGNKILFAKWTAIEYGITYELNGGTNSIDNPSKYTIENAITFANPTKVGYTFGGWYSEDTFTTQVTEIATGSTENKTLFANWTINKYTIKFDTNGGGTITDTTYDILGMPNTFISPTKRGYDFSAWYDNATFEGSPITAITKDNIGDKTLYAKWTAIEYGITYKLNGGALAEPYPKTYTIETETTLVGATRVGYTFLGWYDNIACAGDAITTIPVGTIYDKTFYAKWKIVTYGITYDLKGGSNNHDSNPNTYTIEDPITFGNPTHADNWMSFDGWYTAATDGTKVTTIPLGSTGNLTLYAHWNFTGTQGLKYTKTNDGKAWEVAAGTVESGVVYIPSKYEEGDVTLPVNIKTEAFYNKKGITKVVIEDSLKSIGSWAFTYCEALVSVNIPSDIKIIEMYTFAGCSSLTSIFIPSSVTEIKNDAFKDCTALTSVNIPSSVTSIDVMAFAVCSKLQSIFIPNSVTTIGYSAFARCTNLTISCERAFAPVYDAVSGSGWHDTPTVKWYGDVPLETIKWSQTRPKLVP